ncbi:hypothetical protein [uncultured Tenacibaculum sp.]|uniref:hypothetical protein n=1 Tax=uncultured Tenacibaculum sp. TaxID=174713 RepID=UPI002628DCAD|nr:hypothetical protein [uncultured Tenacibaculum sp.]
MNTRVRLITVLTFVIILGIRNVISQKVEVKNNIEYLVEDDNSEDLNTIKKVISKVKNENRKINFKDAIRKVDKLQKKTKVLRFRKKRRKNTLNKCFAEKSNEC